MSDGLEDLNFGALAAEREGKRLEALFVPSKSFDHLREGRKIIVLGHRGAGKTALLMQLGAHARRVGEAVVELSPEIYAYELLSESLKSEADGAWAKRGAYAAAWRQLLYVLAMKASLSKLPGLKTGPAKRIYNFLRDNYRDVDTNPVGALLSYLKRLEVIKLGNFEASIKARELHRLYRLEEIEPILDDLEYLCQRTSVLVLIDELDRGWDASEDAVAFVAGLFQAASMVSIRTPSVKVVLSLRRELYDNIPALFDDAQKIRDVVELVDWGRPQLLEIMARRIRTSLGVDRVPADPRDAWDVAMPARVDGRGSFGVLLDHTFHRPRELIQLCSEIASAAKKRAGASLPLTAADVFAALPVFCEDRFQDLVAELRFQYPGLGSVLETFRGSPRILSREDAEMHCLRLVVGELGVDPVASEWVSRKEPDEVLEILWRVGFFKARPATSESAFVGPHEVRTLNTRLASQFMVHDLFAVHLGCVSGSDEEKP